jgi:hypothetical protein
MLSGSPVRKMSCLNETICRFKCEYGSPPTEKRVVSWKKTRFFVATAREEKGSNKILPRNCLNSRTPLRQVIIFHDVLIERYFDAIWYKLIERRLYGFVLFGMSHDCPETP